MYKFLPIAVLLLLGFTTSSLANPSPLRLGVGASSLNIQYDTAGLNDGATTDGILFAEFTQGEYSATRLMFYRFKDTDTKVYGGETQLLLGYGLSKPGLRLYTGPTWHIEHMHLPATDQSHHFRGFAWQAGLGWQYKQIALDYSFGIRDNKHYNRKMRKHGYEVEHVFLHSVLLSFNW